MTDIINRLERKQGAVVRFVIMTGWMLLIIICLMLISSVCYLSVFSPEAPVNDNLVKFAFAASGFLFGTFPSLLKELLISTNSGG